jgi:phosphatidylglycerophosphate synthase
MRYRFSDLLLAPAWLSWLRLPLAACFALFVDRPFVALGVLIAAGLSDVLDGWVARRYGLVTATGAALDPITDKLFVLTVAVTLVASGHFSVAAVLLLSTREIGELPLVMWFACSPAARAARAAAPSANAGGKLATALQFGTVGWALLGQPRIELWIAAASIAGVLAALGYWRRALRMRPSSTSDSGVQRA